MKGRFKLSKVVAIVGPTAVGKTDLSIQIAKAFHGEVISGDSMQVYRHLDIGTAKIRPDEMAGVPHHLIDIVDVDHQYSVAEFKSSAGHLIKEISGRDHLPLIVGGTGFYLQALTNNLTLGSQQSTAFRQHWEAVAKQQGPQFVWDQLKQQDEAAAQQIPVGNTRRVIRALEVIHQTGHRFSDQPQQEAVNDYLLVGLTTNRPVLYDRINKRVDLMMKAGLLDEARWLFDHGGATLPAGKGIGYHELFPYFTGDCDLTTAVDNIKKDSRHYAKRQLTWFRNKMDVHWFDLVSGKNQPNDVKELIEDWLNK